MCMQRQNDQTSSFFVKNDQFFYRLRAVWPKSYQRGSLSSLNATSVLKAQKATSVLKYRSAEERSLSLKK